MLSFANLAYFHHEFPRLSDSCFRTKTHIHTFWYFDNNYKIFPIFSEWETCDKLREADKDLLKYLKVKHIFDMMVENKKVRLLCYWQILNKSCELIFYN